MNKEHEMENEYVLLKTMGGSSSKGNVEVSLVASVREPSTALSMKDAAENRQLYTLRLFRFLDDEHFSLLDALLLQLGVSAVHLQELSQIQGAKQLSTVLEAQNIHTHFLSKAHLSSSFDVIGFLRDKTVENSELLEAERERRSCLTLLPALFDLQGWRNHWPEKTHLRLHCDTPTQCLCLDSAAAEAVNLFPSPSSHSQSGGVDSLYTLFARYCRTKLGPKTLERWLRQPLLDVAQIEQRLDVVEALLHNPKLRSALRDSGLKSIPDVLPAISKMHKGSAGLTELFKLYLFSRAVSSIASLLQTEMEECEFQNKNNNIGDAGDSEEKKVPMLSQHFSSAFVQLAQSLQMYESLIEHVVDLTQLPDLRVAPCHDSVLQELQDEETDILTNQVDHEVKQLRNTLASNRDTMSLCDSVRLETQHSQYGLCLRSPRVDDERLLRDLVLPRSDHSGTGTPNTSGKKTQKVRILSILKNGVYFVTDTLGALGDRLLEIRRTYESRQSEVVEAAVQTAVSYLPVFESAGTQCATLDVLQAFATQAAECPSGYVRPELLPLCDTSKDVEILPVFEVSRARHPCVELCLPGNSRFVPNDYHLSVRNTPLVDPNCDISSSSSSSSSGGGCRQTSTDALIHKIYYAGKSKNSKTNPGDAHPPPIEAERESTTTPSSCGSNTSHYYSPVTVVTGPNTGGKSTYIRTAAVLQVLAQIGSFVPCQSARVSLADRIFCRVGAGDLQQRHVSTFLREMLETTRMLRHATQQSLLVIDELGRGTSTAEGFGLACAIATHIATQLRCRCLFATHFHELTELSVCHNLHVAATVRLLQHHTDTKQRSSPNDAEAERITTVDADEVEEVQAGVGEKAREEVQMRYEVREGACAQSFGVHVAQMVDCPQRMLREAKRKLHLLETHYRSDARTFSSTTDEHAAPNTEEGMRKRLKSVISHFDQLNNTLQVQPKTASQQLRELKRLFPESLLTESH